MTIAELQAHIVQAHTRLFFALKRICVTLSVEPGKPEVVVGHWGYGHPDGVIWGKRPPWSPPEHALLIHPEDWAGICRDLNRRLGPALTFGPERIPSLIEIPPPPPDPNAPIAHAFGIPIYQNACPLKVTA